MGLAHLLAMFAGAYVTTYMPLGWLAFALLRAAAGLQPSAFHAASLAAHWLVACAFFAACRRLFKAAGARGGDGAALIAAALFCVHPIQTGSVAWAIELPDLLSTLFFLLAVRAYIDAPKKTAWCAALFAVSLLFRWKSACLPVVLLALDRWPLGRPPRVKEKLPLFALSAAAVAATFSAKRGASYAASFSPAGAARGLLLFPWKLLWPAPQRAVYPLAGAPDAFGLSAAAALSAVAALTGACWVLRRRAPALLLAWTCFAAAVLPSTLMARDGTVFVFLPYGYLGCLGFFALAGEGLRRVPGRAAIAAALGLALCLVSRGEARVWKDSVRFWTRAWALDPDCRVAYGNLGGALIDRGRYNDAYFFLGSQLNYNPGDPVAGDNMRVLKSRAPGLVPDEASFWADEAADLLDAGRPVEAARAAKRAR